MGNTLGSKKTAKVMKINGEEFKLKTPIQAGEVVKDYPGHVLLESEAVKHYGTRAKPLEPSQELKPKRLYFLVELPKAEKVTRRVRSGINMSAKDRLENLMLSRRSVSDLSIMKPMSVLPEEEELPTNSSGGSGVRVKMRLPRAEVERLIKESRDGADAAEKIVDFCLLKNGNVDNDGDEDRSSISSGSSSSSGSGHHGINGVVKHQQQGHLNLGGHAKRTQVCLCTFLSQLFMNFSYIFGVFSFQCYI